MLSWKQQEQHLAVAASAHQHAMRQWVHSHLRSSAVLLPPAARHPPRYFQAALVSSLLALPPQTRRCLSRKTPLLHGLCPLGCPAARGAASSPAPARRRLHPRPAARRHRRHQGQQLLLFGWCLRRASGERRRPPSPTQKRHAACAARRMCLPLCVRRWCSGVEVTHASVLAR